MEGVFGIEALWRFVNSVQKARCIQNGVVCVEVDQRNISSKSDITRGPDNRPTDLTH
jgi:hypothetical protein